MVMDHYSERWEPYTIPTQPVIVPIVVPSSPRISEDEVKEFRRLLERARQYDKDHGEPDCELESKKQRLLKLAEELGIKIDFV
jgi:hypothetical protein